MEMKNLLFALAMLTGAIFMASHASAQNASVAAACDTQSLRVGYAQAPLVQTQTGSLCIKGTVTTGTAAAVPSTDASGTVTLGGTYQTVFASSTSRKGCLVYNPPTATENLNVRYDGSTIVALIPGQSFNCGAPGGTIISDLVEVTAATTSHAFTAASQ